MTTTRTHVDHPRQLLAGGPPRPTIGQADLAPPARAAEGGDAG
ncbi:MAG TPA: hypothetical protein VFQ80_19275 [Thermomicrobiales bacterium]|nr:hypothetical protein [Thermomicrobiales bacterium]